MNLANLEVFRDADGVAKACATELVISLANLLKTQPQVHLALTGGTVGILTLNKLSELDSSAVDWNRVQIWWGDERYVSQASADRNANQARNAWLNNSSVPESNVHEFPALESGSLQNAVRMFDEELESHFASTPEFDLVLLGVGPDGHVASLFPGHEDLRPILYTVAESDSPKPPAERLSLSYQVLNKAKQIWFIVAGADKAGAVAAAVDAKSQLPVSKVRGVSNRWFADDAAVSLLERQRDEHE